MARRQGDLRPGDPVGHGRNACTFVIFFKNLGGFFDGFALMQMRHDKGVCRLQFMPEILIIPGVGAPIELVRGAKVQEQVSARPGPLLPAIASAPWRRAFLAHFGESGTFAPGVSDDACGLKILQAKIVHQPRNDLWRFGAKNILRGHDATTPWRNSIQVRFGVTPYVYAFTSFFSTCVVSCGDK